MYLPFPQFSKLKSANSIMSYISTFLIHNQKCKCQLHVISITISTNLCFTLSSIVCPIHYLLCLFPPYSHALFHSSYSNNSLKILSYKQPQLYYPLLFLLHGLARFSPQSFPLSIASTSLFRFLNALVIRSLNCMDFCQCTFIVCNLSWRW